MNKIQELVEEKVREMAEKHASIIEQKCKEACHKYQCTPDDLILEYHGHSQIKIKIMAAHFEITNQFTCDNKKMIISHMETNNE